MIDRDLLWKAWPAGYLAVRGMNTVGDWSCIHVDGSLSRWAYGQWGAERPCEFNIDSDIKKTVQLAFGLAENDVRTLLLGGGGLLPNVDPKDTATWACLLADLAEAAGLPFAGEGIAWCRRHAPLEGSLYGQTDPDKVTGWGLVVWANGGDPTREFALPDVRDPALALVMARIQLREEGPEK